MKFGRYGYGLVITAILALLTTLVSLTATNFWLVRTVDLVREPIIWVALLLLLIAALALRGSARWLTLTLLGTTIAINAWRIYPYMAFAPTEIAIGELGEGDRCFTAYALNVKQSNRNYQPVIDQIAQADPDLLLVMETDRAWVDALGGVIGNYPSVESYPLDNTYGMLLATRLEMSNPRFVIESERNVPTFYAEMRVQGSQPFEFVGLHPKPPLPGQNTEERDQNIIEAGLETSDELEHGLVLGDFNDVPWSGTTTTFRQEGNWRDPRVGRGTYATFPADWVLLGWPLDQLMVRGDLGMRDFRVMPATSADHRALMGEICVPD